MKGKALLFFFLDLYDDNAVMSDMQLWLLFKPSVCEGQPIRREAIKLAF